MVLLIVFFSFMIALICRRRRLQRRRTGYVVVGGQTVIPGSVVVRNNAQIAQVFENEITRCSNSRGVWIQTESEFSKDPIRARLINFEKQNQKI